MLSQEIRSFDGRKLKIFRTPSQQDKQDVIVVLPFGVRQGIAERAYCALSVDFNVTTWESRFVLDHDADAQGDSIDARMHARDLACVIDHCGAEREPPSLAGVIGYCSGAGVALLAAALMPTAIPKLVLVSGEYMLPRTQCKQTAFQREIDAILPVAAESPANAQQLFDSICAGRGGQQSEFHQFTSLPFSSAHYLYRHGLNYIAYRNADFLQMAATVPQPVLMMLARGDQQVGPESSGLLARCLPQGAETFEVDGDHYEFCRGNTAMMGRATHFLRRP